LRVRRELTVLGRCLTQACNVAWQQRNVFSSIDSSTIRSYCCFASIRNSSCSAVRKPSFFASSLNSILQCCCSLQTLTTCCVVNSPFRTAISPIGWTLSMIDNGTSCGFDFCPLIGNSSGTQKLSLENPHCPGQNDFSN